MTFHTLVPPQCTTGMKYALEASIIRPPGIAGEPGFTSEPSLAWLNPPHQGRYLRALVPQHRAIYAGQS